MLFLQIQFYLVKKYCEIRICMLMDIQFYIFYDNFIILQVDVKYVRNMRFAKKHNKPAPKMVAKAAKSSKPQIYLING